MSSATSSATAATEDVAIRADAVSRTISGRRVIVDLSMHVERGAVFGLLGPNGAGKTTTVRLLTGLLAPDSGAIEVLGESMTPERAAALRRRIGVQTDYRLYKELTLRENLRFWGELYGLDPAGIERRVHELTRLLALSERLDSRVGELSKGMTLKAVIARTLLPSPDVVFLDEPTAGLDPEAAESLLSYLRVIADGGTTLFVCTHQLHGFEGLCDRIGILAGGRLVAEGAVGDLIADRWPEECLDLRTDEPERAQKALAAVGIPSTPEEGGVRARIGGAGRAHEAVRAVVEAGIRLDAAVPRRHTLKELYFATIDGSIEEKSS